MVHAPRCMLVTLKHCATSADYQLQGTQRDETQQNTPHQTLAARRVQWGCGNAVRGPVDLECAERAASQFRRLNAGSAFLVFLAAAARHGSLRADAAQTGSWMGSLRTGTAAPAARCAVSRAPALYFPRSSTRWTAPRWYRRTARDSSRLCHGSARVHGARVRDRPRSPDSRASRDR